MGGKRPARARCVRVRFWEAIRAGAVVSAASAGAGVSVTTGQQWFGQAGGVINNGVQPATGRYLSFAEREEIALGWAQGGGVRQIAAELGRSPSTINRELQRNGSGPRPDRPSGRVRYRATTAEDRAQTRARRPKTAKLAAHPRLRREVQDGLTAGWSPEQIRARLAREFGDDPEMRVSHETIYQSLYVQGRGALRRDLTRCLRTGRALRKPRRQAQARQPRIQNMIMISDRPAEADDRAVPGHWEGDLILGADNATAIGTLVERSTRFCLLLHLPNRHDAEAVRDAMIPAIQALPDQLKRSLAWDQGCEMARHTEISAAADIAIYFCDPHSPWQRGSNENTNGLLRQYFPKGTDLSVHRADHLTAVAAQLNSRPRKTLGWDTPAEALAKLLSPPDQQVGVATTS